MILMVLVSVYILGGDSLLKKLCSVSKYAWLPFGLGFDCNAGIFGIVGLITPSLRLSWLACTYSRDLISLALIR